MSNYLKISGWVIIGFSIFLILDSILALILGESYMLWGLENTPVIYRTLIKRISELPSVILFGIKLAEGILGLGLFLLAYKLIK